MTAATSITARVRLAISPSTGPEDCRDADGGWRGASHEEGPILRW
ncbi:hypothetical protein ACVFYP_00095 [Roseomonas sp. F4]